MSSLRDQLLQKGLVSKKRARAVDRQQQRARKDQQGQKRKKRAIDEERRAEEKATRETAAERRQAARAAASQVRDAYEAALRVRNLILGHRLDNRGPHPFFHKGRAGRLVFRMSVHLRVAEELRRGNLAIALLDHGNRDEYVLIGRIAAEKLHELAPDVLMHWVRQPSKDPSEALLERDWEPCLGPHRHVPYIASK